MEERDAVVALVGDLYWQVDQMGPRGIKNKAGSPYNPTYYKRGLRNAIGSGGLAVPEYVRGFLYKPASDGFKKLQDADSLDLACEALVADADKPYAHLFTDTDRQAAHDRLAPHIAAIKARNEATQTRIEARRSKLPTDLRELHDLAERTVGLEEAIAINMAVLEQAPDDVVATIRIGRAYEALGRLEAARDTFRAALDLVPGNAIAANRLRDVERRLSR